MAVSDVPLVSTVAPRLDLLLRRACDVKQSTSIDPPLQVSELVNEGESLLGDIEGEKEVRLLAIESAAKRVFYANLVSLSRQFLKPSTHVTRDQLGSRSLPS